MTVHREPLSADVDPLHLLTADFVGAVRRSFGQTRLFWSSPDSGISIAGLGCAAEIHADRLADVVDRLGGAAGSDWASAGRGRDGTSASTGGARGWFADTFMGEGAPALVTLAFDPSRAEEESRQDTRWDGLDGVRVLVPEVSVSSGPDGTWLTTTMPETSSADAREHTMRIVERLHAGVAEPGHQPDVSAGPIRLPDTIRASLRDRVARAIAAIRDGRADKVVLATHHTVALREPRDAVSVLARHGLARQGVFRILVQRTAQRAFVATSPERLIAVEGTTARTMALAGSTARGEGPDADRELGQALLDSAKDRAEHQWVVDAVSRTLAPMAREMVIPSSPRLKRLPSIQHLETPIEVRLKNPVHILDLAALMQPTPALGGSPRDAALQLIRELEPAGRGLYGGAVGWVDAAGNGDLAVAIRCMLLHGEQATAFAGAGLVADSDPDAEVREIELKLSSVLHHVQ